MMSFIDVALGRYTDLPCPAMVCSVLLHTMVIAMSESRYILVTRFVAWYDISHSLDLDLCSTKIRRTATNRWHGTSRDLHVAADVHPTLSLLCRFFHGRLPSTIQPTLNSFPILALSQPVRDSDVEVIRWTPCQLCNWPYVPSIAPRSSLNLSLWRQVSHHTRG
jgi:hypothetical protein